MLLRARAIENQCLRARARAGGASTRTSASPTATRWWSIPWGLVIARASEGEGLALAPVDPELLARIRRNLPCLQHRRLLD